MVRPFRPTDGLVLLLVHLIGRLVFILFLVRLIKQYIFFYPLLIDESVHDLVALKDYRYPRSSAVSNYLTSTYHSRHRQVYTWINFNVIT